MCNLEVDTTNSIEEYFGRYYFTDNSQIYIEDKHCTLR